MTYDNASYRMDELYAKNQAALAQDECRHRALSFSSSRDANGIAHAPKRSGRSVRDRNRRRRSYNPNAYAAETSSSESECASIGSVDASDWRRRSRRLSSLSASNTSIRSDLAKRGRSYLRPESLSGKMLGRSPPPSSTILSGLSPTSVSRLQRNSASSSSDSSL